MNIKLEDKLSQPVLYIRMRTRQDQLPRVIGENYAKIADYMTRQGELPSGAPYTAYYNLDMQDLDLEMGFPTSKLLPEGEDIKAREIEAGKVVSAKYKGPYSGMAVIYAKVFNWMADHNYRATGISYEYYLNSPQDVPESDLLTEIVIPVQPAG